MFNYTLHCQLWCEKRVLKILECGNCEVKDFEYFCFSILNINPKYQYYLWTLYFSLLSAALQYICKTLLFKKRRKFRLKWNKNIKQYIIVNSSFSSMNPKKLLKLLYIITMLVCIQLQVTMFRILCFLCRFLKRNYFIYWISILKVKNQ